MISRHSFNGTVPTVRLGDVVEFLDSMRRPVTESDRRAGPYPYYGANGKQGTIDGFIFDEPLLLLAEDGGHFDTPDRGIAYRIAGKTWVNNHAHVLRPKKDVDLGFLCRVLENYDVRPWVTGTTRGKLTQAGAAQILIPVPPLPEQRRIAEILDMADELRAKRRTAIAQIDELKQSIFLDMFGDLTTNPKNFEAVRLGDIVSVIGGYAFRSNDFAESGLPIVRIANLNGDNVDLTHVARIPASKLGKGASFGIDPGDILIAMSGATTGKLGVVPPDILEPIYQNQRVGRYQIKQPSRIIAEYLLGFLRSQYYQSWLWGFAAGVAQPNVSSRQLESAIAPLPPMSLQEGYAAAVDNLGRLGCEMSMSLNKLDILFASLQHRAFRGEL